MLLLLLQYSLNQHSMQLKLVVNTLFVVCDKYIQRDKKAILLNNNKIQHIHIHIAQAFLLLLLFFLELFLLNFVSSLVLFRVLIKDYKQHSLTGIRTHALKSERKTNKISLMKYGNIRIAWNIRIERKQHYNLM